MDPRLAKGGIISPAGLKLCLILLEVISGYKLEFLRHPPGSIQLETTKAQVLSQAVLELASKGAIVPSNRSKDCYISQIFLVPKSDGSWCPVINLKSLNRWIVVRHFKMESIRTVKKLLMPRDWLVKLDLKDAYLTVPIHNSHQKFLRFCWEGREWQFQALPIGLSSAPYIFTKGMKPVIATMRRLGIRLILYLNDMLIKDQSIDRVKCSLATAVEVLISLGFIINLKKSVTVPAQEIQFLGFSLDSQAMSIALPQSKLHSLTGTVREMKEKEQTTLRDLAQLLGSMVAAHSAILPAPLYYCNLERARSKALHSGLTYESEIVLDHPMRADMEWWATQCSQHNSRPLQIPHWNLMIETDASTLGWGANCEGVTTGGS